MLTLIRVGSDERVASDDDIKDVREAFLKAQETGEDIVTHHLTWDAQYIDPASDEVVIWHVGTHNYPASPDDIEDVQARLAEIKKENKPNPILVLHHAIRVSYAKLR